jgi:hypothetical protein
MARAGLPEEAITVASSIGDPDRRVQALAAVAEAMANRGDTRQARDGETGLLRHRAPDHQCQSETRNSTHLALAVDGSFDHRRISALHLIREAESWSALRTGEAEQIVAMTLTDFTKALDHVPVPHGVPAAAAAQLAWNVERLQAGAEIGERPSGYRRRRNRP